MPASSTLLHPLRRRRRLGAVADGVHVELDRASEQPLTSTAALPLGPLDVLHRLVDLRLVVKQAPIARLPST